jgi:hypothetical protein
MSISGPVEFRRGSFQIQVNQEVEGMVLSTRVFGMTVRKICFKKTGGEGGIRTLDSVLPPYSLSRGAPSATRPPLREVSETTVILFLNQ